MSKPKRKRQRVRIRKGSLGRELYLDRKGSWVSWLPLRWILIASCHAHALW